MLTTAGGLFSKIINAPDIKLIKGTFEVSASEYWEDHYVFGRISRSFTKTTGQQATDILLVNAVLPVLFCYGKWKDRPDICERAVSFFDGVQAEDNTIINEWRSAGIKAGSSFYSQALIQLRNNYCRKRKCLQCRIGSKLISAGRKLRDEDELILEP
jgi:hypothetical protein